MAVALHSVIVMKLLSKALLLEVAATLILSTQTCSSEPEARTKQTALLDSGGPAPAEGYGSYDPASLKEIRNLSGFPNNLNAVLGWHSKSTGGTAPGSDIVDAGEPFPHIDVVGGRPSRRFLVGGLGKTSALVAYEQEGWRPQYFATAYVLGASGWTLVGRWRIEWATTLTKVLDQTKEPPPRLERGKRHLWGVGRWKW
jgi:hypothetical protein